MCCGALHELHMVPTHMLNKVNVNVVLKRQIFSLMHSGQETGQIIPDDFICMIRDLTMFISRVVPRLGLLCRATGKIDRTSILLSSYSLFDFFNI